MNIGNLEATIRLKDEFTATLKKITKDLDRQGDMLQSAGMRISAGISAPLAAIGAFSLKAASDFESSFAGIRKTMDKDTTEAQFSAIATGIRNMAKEIPTGTTELNKIAIRN